MVSQIHSKRILVIGDVMLDTYYHGEVKRISPEAPVPVFRKKSERSVLGGAANVAANLIAAGQQTAILSVVGTDENGATLREIFREKGVDTSLLVGVPRCTTRKTRFLAENHQQVLRLDEEDTRPIDSETSGRLLTALKDAIGQYDLLLISDYCKGLLTVELTQGVIRLAGECGIPVIVDVKDPAREKYRGAFLLKPNLKELHDLTGMPVDSDGEILAACEELRESCDCRYVLTTCGARGMVLVGDGTPYFVEAVCKEVFDVSGAGDTTAAYLAACLANGISLREAVDIANCAAGIQVTKVGTSAVYWPEVSALFADHADEPEQKRMTADMLASFRAGLAGKRVVFTNGCFDILHVGHIRYLQEAAKLGDVLIVGLNSDASVKRLKGPERPVNGEKDRAELLCALGFVDHVVIFEEDTPYALIEKLQPDVLVKGGDYRPEEVVGKDLVEANGGRLVLLPFVEGHSTTNIIEKLKG